jgi:uncharacterized phiE125 gp8 family phage protein
MTRVILVPADLSGAPLAELKQWLAISSTADDAALTALLHAALALCEGFTGSMPLAAECEQLLPAVREWQGLSTRPVQSITGIETLAVDGARATLAPEDYEFDLHADGTGTVRLLRVPEESRIAVRFTAGLAPDWASLPQALCQGIVRLAAHHFRERDAAEMHAAPASVSALWRPWRRLHLL